MIKVLNNLMAVGLPALVILFGIQCFRYWWRNRNDVSVLMGSIFAVLYGVVTISNLAVSAHGRFFGKYTWGPRYAQLEAAGIVFLTLSFLSVCLFVLKKAEISSKKPLLLLLGIGALAGIAFILLETFG